ncbi:MULTISPECIES: sigma factor G inhibitor Gin [Bacillaceae]|uniref:sigma factor G inhibitor Gin n=1 Tax=Bacillaceae TaxID=186817 RepID=UPI0011895844|nr:sigma factor G inhibitor Gin [Bacillus sp. S3]QCJ40463.1 sigma factor G inhibitor Gin [Bacillus sp. S3]
MEVGGLSSFLAHKHYYVETCVICENQKSKGIHLYTSFICTECENDLIQTDTNDPKYKYFLKQLRKITNPEIFS